MIKRKNAGKRKPKRRGPLPEVLQLSGEWQEILKTAVRKRKPTGGWPKRSR